MEHGMRMPPGSSSMSHMSFFWGRDSEILFSGWPGARTGMYVLALICVFALAFLVELLSYYLMARAGSPLRSLLHGLRVGLAYLLMLALMSFNAGVFIVAVAGHTLGFLVFRTRLFNTFLNHSDKLDTRLANS